MVDAEEGLAQVESTRASTCPWAAGALHRRRDEDVNGNFVSSLVDHPET